MDRKMSFTIKGKKELMTHNPESMQHPNERGGKSTVGKTKIPTPEEEAKAGLYIVDGNYCVPGIGVRNAMVAVASDWKPLTGKKRGNLQSTIAHITVEPEFLVICDQKGKPKKTYEIDTRRAVIQRQGILRSRPKFKDWTVTFDVVYDDAFLPLEEESIRELFTGLLNDAGKRRGLGDYRPERKGWFGIYSV